MNVERIERTLLSIQEKLLNNENLLKLLYYSNPDPLSGALVDRVDGEELITLNPILKYGPAESINNFISLGLPQVNEQDSSIIIEIDIAIFCNVDGWILNNRQIRIMQIIKEMQQTIENKNFNTSGSLQLNGMTPAILDDLGFAGYYVSAKLVDNVQEIDI